MRRYENIRYGLGLGSAILTFGLFWVFLMPGVDILRSGDLLTGFVLIFLAMGSVFILPITLKIVGFRDTCILEKYFNKKEFD